MPFVGIPVTIDVQTRNASNVLADPTTLTAIVRAPGNTSDLSAAYPASGWAKTTTGVYVYTYTPTQQGHYKVAFTSVTSTTAANTVVEFDVAPVAPF